MFHVLNALEQKLKVHSKNVQESYSERGTRASKKLRSRLSALRYSSEVPPI